MGGFPGNCVLRVHKDPFTANTFKLKSSSHFLCEWQECRWQKRTRRYLQVTRRDSQITRLFFLILILQPTPSTPPLADKCTDSDFSTTTPRVAIPGITTPFSQSLFCPGLLSLHPVVVRLTWNWFAMKNYFAHVGVDTVVKSKCLSHNFANRDDNNCRRDDDDSLDDVRFKSQSSSLSACSLPGTPYTVTYDGIVIPDSLSTSTPSTAVNIPWITFQFANLPPSLVSLLRVNLATSWAEGGTANWIA